MDGQFMALATGHLVIFTTWRMDDLADLFAPEPEAFNYADELATLAKAFFVSLHHPKYQPRKTKYHASRSNILDVTLNTTQNRAAFADQVRRPHDRPFGAIFHLPYRTNAGPGTLDFYAYSKDCPSNSDYEFEYHKPRSTVKLNYGVTFVHAHLTSASKSKKPLNLKLESYIQLLATINAPDACSLANDVLILMKASDKILKKSSIATTSLKLVSLFLTTERLRHENALSLVYMCFYSLKHGQSHLLASMFNAGTGDLVFPRKGGADLLRQVTSDQLLARFFSLAQIYHAKPVLYRQRVSLVEWLIRRLNKLAQVHGHQSDPGAYVHSGGQYRFVPFGGRLYGFANTLKLRHIFVSGQGNASLLRALHRANDGPEAAVYLSAGIIRRSVADQVITCLDGNTSVEDPLLAYVMLDLLEHLENSTLEATRVLLGELIPILQGGLLKVTLQAPIGPTQRETLRHEIQDGVQDLLADGNIIQFLKAYLNRTLAVQNRFEGESMIRILSCVLNRRVAVHTDTTILIFNRSAPTQSTLHLYNTSYAGVPEKRNHYNVLLP